MAIAGISKYRPQLYTPKWSSYYNKLAVQQYDATIEAAGGVLFGQMSTYGNDLVTLTIQQAADRIKKQAQAKLDATMKNLSFDKTV